MRDIWLRSLALISRRLDSRDLAHDCSGDGNAASALRIVPEPETPALLIVAIVLLLSFRLRIGQSPTCPGGQSPDEISYLLGSEQAEADKTTGGGLEEACESSTTSPVQSPARTTSTRSASSARVKGFGSDFNAGEKTAHRLSQAAPQGWQR